MILVDLNQNQIASQQKGFSTNATAVPAALPPPPASDPRIARIPVKIDVENAQDAYLPNGGGEFSDVAAIITSAGLVDRVMTTDHDFPDELCSVMNSR